MKISVIIPNYNRQEPVLRALDSLCQQTLPADQYEVIVVDDGSTADTSRISRQEFPFSFQFLRKQNEGATIARNFGVRHSQGEILVFMDDDVTAAPPALAALAQTLERENNIIAMGNLVDRIPIWQIGQNDLPNRSTLTEKTSTLPSANQFLHFSQCNTQLLAVKRADFFALDMLQDPTGGWPNWDDVDFGYRAHLAGFRLLQVGAAAGEHWDFALADLGAACRRWQKAGQSAVKLFQVHPGLRPHIPMFHDKMPINWREDSFRLVVRKLARMAASTRPSIWAMERLAALLARVYPSAALLRPLHRWIQGGYMFRGYREGLHEHR